MKNDHPSALPVNDHLCFLLRIPSLLHPRRSDRVKEKQAKSNENLPDVIQADIGDPEPESRFQPESIENQDDFTDQKQQRTSTTKTAVRRSGN